MSATILPKAIILTKAHGVAVSMMAKGFISPLNIYMHRKCEVPGSNSGFTSRN